MSNIVVALALSAVRLLATGGAMLSLKFRLHEYVVIRE
jgi:hypothetical protein